MLQWAMAAGFLLPCLAMTADGADARARRGKCAAAAVLGGQGKCRAAHRAGLVYIPQISPAIRRARAPNLEEPRCGPCLKGPDRWYWRRYGRERPAPRPDLIEALQQPPSAATAPVLDEAGIPQVQGVPPIVVLRPKTGREWERTFRLRAAP